LTDVREEISGCQEELLTTATFRLAGWTASQSIWQTHKKEKKNDRIEVTTSIFTSCHISGGLLTLGQVIRKEEELRRKRENTKLMKLGLKKVPKPNIFDLLIKVKNMRTIYFEKSKILIQLNNFLGVGLTTFF
jgi:hypothetical protein